MKKIGFIDYFLDEWHANNYPAWFKENGRAIKGNYEVAYAWADIDSPGGLTTEAWGEKHGVEILSSIEELVEKSDYIIVLSPDHPDHHERLAEIALMSGKPVYIDKTFSPDLASGQRMFELAEEHETPLFSSSALRFTKELSDYPNDPVNPQTIEFITTGGPGTYKNYSVHQFEMIVSQMGVGAKRIKSLSTEHSNLLMIDYGNGRMAQFAQMQHLPFQINMQLKNGEGILINECSDIFIRLIDAIITFFETSKSPAPKEETLEIMALIEAGAKAIENYDTWISV